MNFEFGKRSIDKFSNIETVCTLVKDGTLSAEDIGKLKLNTLRNVLDNSYPWMISREEKHLILGKRMLDRMDALKEEEINRYVNDKHYIDREPREAERKELVEREFKWSIAHISKLLFEKNSKNMNEDFIKGITFSDEGYKEYFKNIREVNANAEKFERRDKYAYDILLIRLLLKLTPYFFIFSKRYCQ